jgi:YVTN family beta-propeller protein
LAVIRGLRRGLAEQERGFATLLFTDICGSTELAAELGDRGWREVLRQHHAFVRRQLKRYRGREVDTAGDGFFATFEQPARAVRCACTLVQGLKEFGITIRAGLHAGEVERMEDRLGGIAVHLGARVAGAAGEGEVLVSSTLRDMLAGSDLRFEDRGLHRLKGVPGEWRLFAVDAASAAETTPPPRPLPPAEQGGRWTPRRLAVAAAAALLLGGAVAAAVVLLTGGASANPVPGVNSVGRIDPETDRFHGHPIPVGATPTNIVADGDTLWVTNYDDKTISKIDSAGHVVATPSIGGTPTGITFADDSVWVAAGLGLQSGAPASVVEVDAVDNQLSPPIQLSSGLTGIAFDGVSIWVANENEDSLVRIDPKTRSVEDDIPVGQKPEAVAADRGGVWVANTLSRTVMRLDRNGRRLYTTPLRSGPTALALGADAVWAASRLGATVTRLDRATGNVEATIDVATAPNGIAAGAGAVWVTMPGRVQRIDPRTNLVTATIPVPADADGVAVADGSVWTTVHAP